MKEECWELIMSVRKLLLVFSACALMVPVSIAAQAGKSAANQRLYEKAHKVCSGPEYSNGTYPYINYTHGWFRCVEPKLKGRRNKHG